MAKDTGFFQLRRGIWEHVRDGRLSLQDVAIHQYIASQADTRTGVWNGSAGALAGELCISSRMARRFIERLTRGDYIRRFPIPGRHVCYPILVHKFLITDGQHKGEQLNALASTSPADLRYFPGEQEGEHKGEHVSSQKKLETIDLRRTLPPQTVKPPSEEAVALASLLRERILQNNPAAKIAESQPIRWAREADLMMRRDNRTAEQIQSVIEWSQQDQFWRSNVLSMSAVSKQFNRLTLKIQDAKLGSPNGSKPTIGKTTDEPIRTLTAEEIPA